MADIPDRVVLIDPRHPKYSVGLNYLELHAGTDPGALAHRALAGISRLFKEDATTMPLWQKYGTSTLRALAQAGYTLLDILYFSDPQGSAFREHVLRQVPEFHSWKTWHDLELNYPRIADRSWQTMSTSNRGDKFHQVEAFRLMVGQPRNTIDWSRAMDEGLVILCNLGSGDHLPSELARQLGVIIFHQIHEAARARRDQFGVSPRPFYFYIDEFGRVASDACDDAAEALDVFRQHGVPLILAIQRLGQLRDADGEQDLLDAALANTLLRMVFRVHNADAEILVRELFTPEIDPYKIKYQGTRQVLTPHSGVERRLSGSSSITTPLFSPGARIQGTLITQDGWHEASVTDYDVRIEPDTPVYLSIDEQVHEYKRRILEFPPGCAYLKTPWGRPVRVRGHLPQQELPAPEDIARFRDRSAEIHNVPRAADVRAAIDERHRQLLCEDYAEFLAAMSAGSSAELPAHFDVIPIDETTGEAKREHDVLVALRRNKVRAPTARSLVRSYPLDRIEHHIRIHEADPHPNAKDPKMAPKRLVARIKQNWEPPAPEENATS